MEIKDLAKNSFANESTIKQGVPCGCYHCGKVFDGGLVVNWIDAKEENIPRTALCPYCSVDAVVANVTNEAFLSCASNYWF